MSKLDFVCMNAMNNHEESAPTELLKEINDSIGKVYCRHLLLLLLLKEKGKYLLLSDSSFFLLILSHNPGGPENDLRYMAFLLFHENNGVIGSKIEDHMRRHSYCFTRTMVSEGSKSRITCLAFLLFHENNGAMGI
ncbi:hypothetical protein ACFE04_014039 [Oxalis oulophora]